MAKDELKATEIDLSKSLDEYAEVEKLIQETLAETKAIKKSPEPGPAAPKPAAPAPAPKPKQPDSYESTFKEYKPGDIVKGKVIKIDASGVLVDINYKSDGLILLEDLSDKPINSVQDAVKVGEIIEVCIKTLENKEGYVLLSKSIADYERKWKKVSNALKNKELLEGRVIQVLRGGLVIECNDIRGFVPASQVEIRPGQSLDSFKDKTIPVKVLEYNQRQGKIVFSHRAAAGEKEKLESSKIFNEIEPGQIRKGKVANLKTFGAFVDIGGIEGLIHLSELSWKRVKHPSEVLKTGQEIEVLVLGVDKVSKKISLGYKELLPDPWVNAKTYFKPGQVVKARVLRFAKFGAFCELDHELEGLIHNSEISKEPVNNPADVLKIGDEVEVKVLRIVPEEQKIGLSIREVILEKERKAVKEIVVDQPKVTIADMIAQKEKEKKEREEEAAELEEEMIEEEAASQQEAPTPEQGPASS